MRASICVPSEDVRDHVEAALRGMTRAISDQVLAHLEAARDDAACTVTLERAQEAISANGWAVDDLKIELSLDDVKRAIDSNGWAASDLGIASTDIAECVAEHGTRVTLWSVLSAEETGELSVLTTLWSLIKPECRAAFLGASVPAVPASPAVDLDSLRAEIRAEIRREMLGKVVALIG
jgi:hypothetical protein